MPDLPNPPPILFKDPRFAAGRGEEFSAARQRERRLEEIHTLAALDGTDFRLPIDHRIEENVQLDGVGAASLDSPLPQDNRGYKLLEKMGWNPGSGLGKHANGIVDPVAVSSIDNGLRTGLGRAAIDKELYDADNVVRRPMETEVQANEDEERAKKREIEAQRAQRIRDDVTDALKTFFCEVCSKQYTSAMELDAHLSSYDHHHKKRMVEMKAMVAGQGRKEREKREKKDAVREQARLDKQLREAQRARGEAVNGDFSENLVQVEQQQPPLPCSPPPPLPPPLPPLPPPDGPAVTQQPGGWANEMNNNNVSNTGNVVGVKLALSAPLKATLVGKPAVVQVKKGNNAGNVFGDDSSDDE